MRFLLWLFRLYLAIYTTGPMIVHLSDSDRTTSVSRFEIQHHKISAKYKSDIPERWQRDPNSKSKANPGATNSPSKVVLLAQPPPPNLSSDVERSLKVERNCIPSSHPSLGLASPCDPGDKRLGICASRLRTGSVLGVEEQV